MATTTTGAKTTDTADAAAAAAGAGYLQPQVFPRPIVYERTKGGRKKRYSSGLKDGQKLEEGASRAAQRVAQAVADGFGEYRRRRDRSAERKKDGAVKDFVRNLGRGAEEALRTGAKAPTDLTRYLTKKRLTRLVFLPPPFSR
ncbi:MAG TPA: hypothetical protein VN811_05710 [Thermoanaerobaculia bacterium]|nr:hypothetical protein [Thermoanaerobaculia bacterium]HXT50516.1 hypothetical protein [Thermoanaerobaculia bacterium]